MLFAGAALDEESCADKVGVGTIADTAGFRTGADNGLFTNGGVESEKRPLSDGMIGAGTEYWSSSLGVGSGNEAANESSDEVDDTATGLGVPSVSCVVFAIVSESLSLKNACDAGV